MLGQIHSIIQFMVEAFLHVWPYLLVTIPLAVIVRMSGAAKYINRAFQGRPIVAVFLAPFGGAFSPFCPCGVIPVIAALITGGVRLPPMMSFWIASPSMDPEIFFLSVGTLGWELAVWRMASTLAVSLAAGLATHYFARRGWLGSDFLRTYQVMRVRSTWELVRTGWQYFRRRMGSLSTLRLGQMRVAHSTAYSPARTALKAGDIWQESSAGCAEGPPSGEPLPVQETSCSGAGCSGKSETVAGASTCGSVPRPFSHRLLEETWKAVVMVVKFMALAFFMEALIEMYIPSTWITSLLGESNTWAILSAALLGVPIYTSNLAALPMISGLLVQGMQPAAALAFLIAGPATTLPAMAAVWGLVSKRVFALYVGFSLVGAVIMGYVYHFGTG